MCGNASSVNYRLVKGRGWCYQDYSYRSPDKKIDDDERYDNSQGGKGQSSQVGNT